jgi:hypothetical protein
MHHVSPREESLQERVKKRNPIHPLPSSAPRKPLETNALTLFLFLLASAFFGWLAAADAYPVLDLLAAGLAWATSAGLAHRYLLHTRVNPVEARYFPL